MIITAIVLAILSGQVLVINPEPREIEVNGVYECRGVFGKVAYKTTLFVTESKDNYRFMWEDGGKLRARGFGMRVNANLTAIYQMDASKDVGIINYRIYDNRLAGLWTMGDGVTYDEVCVRQL